jgi:hypothetical protein
MIVVCACGQKSRIRDVTQAASVRCSKCKTMLQAQIQRQANRNAAIVLDVAAVLAHRMDTDELTREELTLAKILTQHEKGTV